MNVLSSLATTVGEAGEAELDSPKYIQLIFALPALYYFPFGFMKAPFDDDGALHILHDPDRRDPEG